MSGSKEKFRSVLEAIKERGSLLVAMSGGVDSTLMASLAHEALADRAMAATIDSIAFPEEEMDNARRTAEHIGIQHVVVRMDILSNEDLCMNPEDRCYICKLAISDALWALAKDAGIGHVADGVNSDDFSERRPGIKASMEKRIWHPFVEAGLGKKELRHQARLRGLPTHDRPSSACLISRTSFGEALSEEGLRRIEEAERFLRNLGVTNARARTHGDIIRIEVPREEWDRVLTAGNIDKVIECMRRIGFTFITLDLEGYRPGSMDALLMK